MKGRAIQWSAEELAWIEARCELPRRLLHAVFVYAFNRPDVSMSSLCGLCERKGWMTGRTGCFKPGIVPANKGQKMPFNPRSAATRFVKGGLPHNTKHLGYERVSKEGYTEISIAETNPHTGFERRFVFKHRHLWEQANGPLPDGMCLKCLDGDKSNTDPANWEALPRALLPRLNGKYGRGYDTAPADIKPTILAITKLEHAAREAVK